MNGSRARQRSWWISRQAAVAVSIRMGWWAAAGTGCCPAVAGELALEPWVVSAGGGPAAADGWTLQASVGQVTADSVGSGSAGGEAVLLQAGFLVQSTPWNRPPVPGGDSVARPKGDRVTKVRVASLLSNDTDADGDTLSLASVGRASPGGATVSVVGGFAVYVAADGEAGHGGFEYEVTDGQGNTSWGVVTVLETVPGGLGVQPNALRLEVDGVDRVFTGIGVPGRRYRVQYALEASAPYLWRDFVPVADRQAATSGALGLFQFVDRNPPEAFRLYRAVMAP